MTDPIKKGLQTVIEEAIAAGAHVVISERDIRDLLHVYEKHRPIPSCYETPPSQRDYCCSDSEDRAKFEPRWKQETFLRVLQMSEGAGIAFDADMCDEIANLIGFYETLAAQHERDNKQLRDGNTVLQEQLTRSIAATANLQRETSDLTKVLLSFRPIMDATTLLVMHGKTCKVCPCGTLQELARGVILACLSFDFPKDVVA